MILLLGSLDNLATAYLLYLYVNTNILEVTSPSVVYACQGPPPDELEIAVLTGNPRIQDVSEDKQQ